MSFFVNNKELKKINFNGNRVYSVYYNNNLVWEEPTQFDTVGWDYLYNICKARQADPTFEWPSYIQLGAVKDVYYADTNTFAFKVRLIDIETEGPGILVFQAIWGYGNPPEGSWPGYYYGDIPTHEKSWDFSITPYVKPLVKRTADVDNIGDNGLLEVKSEECRYWHLSNCEVGEESIHYIDTSGYGYLADYEYTEGISEPYPYMTNPENRKSCTSDGTAVRYHLRSHTRLYGPYYVKVDGEVDFYTYQRSENLYCFAIG